MNVCGVFGVDFFKLEDESVFGVVRRLEVSVLKFCCMVGCGGCEFELEFCVWCSDSWGRSLFGNCWFGGMWDRNSWRDMRWMW